MDEPESSERVQVQLLDDLYQAHKSYIANINLSSLLEHNSSCVKDIDSSEWMNDDESVHYDDVSSKLVSDLLPSHIAKRLLNTRNNDVEIAEEFNNVSIMFADICGFTSYCNQVAPSVSFERLNKFIVYIDDSLVDFPNVIKLDVIGDCIMFCSKHPNHVYERIVVEMVEFAHKLLDIGTMNHLQLKIGIHVGPVIGGMIGYKRRKYTLISHSVNFASRLQQTGVPGHIHISEAVHDIIHPSTSAIQKSTDMKGLGQVATYLICPISPICNVCNICNDDHDPVDHDDNYPSKKTILSRIIHFMTCI